MKALQERSQYIDIDNSKWHTPVYRFTTVDRILQLIVQRRNSLISPRKWDDPFENMLSKIKFIKQNGETHFYSLRNRVYGQCWTNCAESDAFWRIYTPSKDGVRIKTTKHKLLNSLIRSQSVYQSMSCFIGQIDYMTESEICNFFSSNKILDYLSDNGSVGQAKSILFKRKEFAHEDEVRLIYLDPNNINHGDVFHYSLAPENLIQEIMFDPRMDDDTFQTCKDVICKHGDYGQKIGKSNLYQIPCIEIAL